MGREDLMDLNKKSPYVVRPEIIGVCTKCRKVERKARGALQRRVLKVKQKFGRRRLEVWYDRAHPGYHE